MWAFLHGLGLWTDVGLLSGPEEDEVSLAVGLWRLGTSVEKGAWAAAPGLEEEEEEEEELTWPCCPGLCLGGTREECWEERPVGLLGGTDRSECWW